MKHCENPKCVPFCKCKYRCDCDSCKKFRSRHLLQIRGTETAASIYQKGGLKFESTSPDLIIHTKDEGNFSTTITFEPLEGAFQKKTESLFQQIATMMNHHEQVLDDQDSKLQQLHFEQDAHSQTLLEHASKLDYHTEMVVSHAKGLANQQVALDSHTDTLIALSDELAGMEKRWDQNQLYLPTLIHIGKTYGAASHISTPILRFAKEETINAGPNLIHRLILEQVKNPKRIIAYGGCFEDGDGNRLPIPFWGTDKSAYLFINKSGDLELDTQSSGNRRGTLISIWVEFTY